MIRKPSLWFFLISIYLVLPSCSSENESSPQMSKRVVELMGGSSQVEIIKKTGTAFAYRIQMNPKLEYGEEIIGEGVQLTPEQQQGLVGLLVRDDAYGWEFAKPCKPRYGVLIKFEDEAKSVRLRFCFSCQMLEFMPSEKGSEDFDPINGELVQWVKGVFPNDTEIQSLGTPNEVHGL